MSRRDLLRRIEKLEQRPPSPARFSEALVRFEETGELPKQPRFAEQVYRYVRFLILAESSVLIGEDALNSALVAYLEHGEIPTLEEIFAEYDGQDDEGVDVAFDWTDSGPPRPSLDAIPEPDREEVCERILKAVRRLARLEEAADRVGLP